jgi:hypothetical protein
MHVVCTYAEVSGGSAGTIILQSRHHDPASCARSRVPGPAFHPAPGHSLKGVGRTVVRVGPTKGWNGVGVMIGNCLSARAGGKGGRGQGLGVQQPRTTAAWSSERAQQSPACEHQGRQPPPHCSSSGDGSRSHQRHCCMARAPHELAARRWQRLAAAAAPPPPAAVSLPATGSKWSLRSQCSPSAAGANSASTTAASTSRMLATRRAAIVLGWGVVQCKRRAKEQVVQICERSWGRAGLERAAHPDAVVCPVRCVGPVVPATSVSRL